MVDQPVLRQMYELGRERWPSLALEYEQFERHCLSVTGGSLGIEAEHNAADLYLCCACAAGDAEALKAFDREGSSVLEAAITRINRDPEFVKDTLQEVWDKLLVGPASRVAEYSGLGPLQAWLRVTATRTALDRSRSMRRAEARQLDLGDYLVGETSGPESTVTRARYMGTFQRSLQRAVSALSPQERNLLRMHVVGHCSIDQIGRAYNVHRATAARWLDRAKAHIFAAVRRDLAVECANLTDSEFNSVAHLVGTELELRLSVGSVGGGTQPSQSQS